MSRSHPLRRTALALLAAFPGIALSQVALATTFTTLSINDTNAAAYGGSKGTITFNDWGYTGPTVGGYTVGVNDFQVGSGFDAGIGNSNIGQIQHVITRVPDYFTPDAQTTGSRAQPTVFGDLFNAPAFTNPNMDGGVNFYKWAYTTSANSTFSNMQIDKAGNYHIAKSDMSFGFYDSFHYRDATGTNPDQPFDTRINFQPYAVSNAKGWCGSVLNPDPGGVGIMAGQVTFDFAMDVYFDNASISGSPGNPGIPDVYSSTQLIPGFMMRSYGDITVDITTPGGDRMQFYSSAVGNNTNPTSVVPGVGGTLDPAYNNLVSFGGAGVVPTGAWVSADSFNADGSRRMRTDNNPTTGQSRQVWDVTIVEAGTPGAVWNPNAYAGYAFILRADGMRILDYVNPTGHSNYVATVPEPETYAMMVVGLGLIGMAVRQRRSA